MEALGYLDQIILAGFQLFCFDFSGSGLSEGEYVTLGVQESEDLGVVVDHLHTISTVGPLVLWGRSMGAVT